MLFWPSDKKAGDGKNSRGLPIKVDFWCALEKCHFLGKYFLINEQKSNLVHNSALYSLVPSESLGSSGLITEEIR